MLPQLLMHYPGAVYLERIPLQPTNTRPPLTADLRLDGALACSGSGFTAPSLSHSLAEDVEPAPERDNEKRPAPDSVCELFHRSCCVNYVISLFHSIALSRQITSLKTVRPQGRLRHW